MTTSVHLALVGDRSPAVTAHVAIEKSLSLARKLTTIEFEWFATDRCETDNFRGVTAFWCVPGSPYRSAVGALRAIRVARENNLRFLGTCGGFQHALIEYARNVIGLAETEHAETNPASKSPLIAPLSCSLVEQSGPILLLSGSRLQKIYGASRVVENYHCNFGLNPEFEQQLDDGQLQFSGRDADGEVRAFELSNHDFFMGTLFQPERRALAGELHPLIKEFLLPAP